MAQTTLPHRAASSETSTLLARLAVLEQENLAMRERLVALGRSEARFRHLVEATGDVVWVTECHPERVVYCSANFEKVWGRSVEALYQDPALWVRCIHDDDRDRIGAAFLQWLADPVGAWEAHFRIVRPDGQLRWIEERGVAMQDHDGKMCVIGASTDITVQRTTAAALRESEERFALAVEGSADGIWDWDLQTGMMFMSERAQGMFGMVPSAVTLRPRTEWLTLVSEPQTDVEERRAAIARYIAGDADRLDAEWRFRQPDGTDRWRRVRGRALRDADGKALRLSGSISDVDDRKRAERALEQSERRHALAMEAAQDGHWDWEVGGGEIHASPRMLEICGLDAGMRFRNPAELLRRFPLHADDRPAWQRALKAHRAGKSDRFVVERRFSRAGEQRWVRISGLLSRDLDGKIVRWTGSISDITDRKAHEAALRESEARFALAVAGSNDGIWDWDAASGMQYYSERAQQIFGLEPGPTKRHRSEWRRLVPVHPDDYHDQLNASTAYLEGRSATYRGEWRIMQSDGSYRWVRFCGESVRDARGVPIRMAGSVSDIDDLKREQAARAQSQRLEAVGTFAGGIAHDFNNILGAILGFGEMSLRRTRAGSRMRRDLECIVTAGERGRALVDRILAFSRSSVSERLPVHVEKVAGESLELLRSTLHGEVRLACELRAGRAAVLGDPTQVHQVIGNLTTNAVQAMPHGGELTVTLECRSLAEELSATTGSIAAGPYVVLTVSDTGSGIALEDRQRIFDPFFTTKEVNVGTGLGLSLVHGIVTEWGGAVDVASTVGEGSTFVVYLPRSGDVAAPPEAVAQMIPRGTQQRILVVDDDPALTRLTSQLCADLGYQWVACTSSIEAARIFSKNPHHFDAVLTDERMPGLSGIGLIESLRQVRDDVPIVMMSGYLGDSLVSRARALGARAVLAKPVARMDLAAALAEALARDRPNGAAKRSRGRAAAR
ncbi:PAS domain S-box-containing protein [Variovorax sp. TBS-050B]|uniref:hybrid sensor histidine kinase/response regulator n=1 Tax=Variovorax sp. TBS-050B TaxID=2940551 RepID=UPI002473BA1C|nr:PAS domain-containing protein [Variovorax sp. TBS-050B]MDH6590195.1 PAS domain S-box-containing protein [Variovorax sp. TBS-050B]